MQYDRLEIFDEHETPDTWLWCLHCERCYQLKDTRVVKHPALKGETLQLCHYNDCTGDTVMDAWNWDEFRAKVDRELPELPTRGVVYPLYD